MSIKLFLFFFIVSNICFAQEKLTIKKIDSLYKYFNNDIYFNKEGADKFTALYYQSREIGYKKG